LSARALESRRGSGAGEQRARLRQRLDDPGRTDARADPRGRPRRRDRGDELRDRRVGNSIVADEETNRAQHTSRVGAAARVAGHRKWSVARNSAGTGGTTRAGGKRPGGSKRVLRDAARTRRGPGRRFRISGPSRLHERRLAGYGECDARHRPDRHDREGPGQAGAVSVPARFAIRSQARSNDGRDRYARARRVDTGSHDRSGGGACIEDERKCREDFRDGAESGIARHPGVPEMQGRPASQRQAGRPGLQRLQTRVSGARRHSNHADRGSQTDRVTNPRRAASLPSAMKTIDARRARQLAWLAMGIYIAGLGISATLRAQGDFNVYYRAGYRALHGLGIYPPADSDHFLYAPIFAIGFAPLAPLPRHLAQFVFFAVNAFSLIEFILGAGVLLFGRE